MGETSAPPGGGGGGGKEDQGGGGGSAGGSKQTTITLSYSDRLKTNVRRDHRLKRNILEITLENTENKSVIDVEDNDIARVFKTLGIDLITQVQGHQVQFRGKTSLISVWMAAGVNLERFCKDVNIRVTENVITGLIRPAGKKDVTVTVTGLDFNTPDSLVIEYMTSLNLS
jgi:hypothetical protein